MVKTSDSKLIEKLSSGIKYDTFLLLFIVAFKTEFEVVDDLKVIFIIVNDVSFKIHFMSTGPEYRGTVESLQTISVNKVIYILFFIFPYLH